MKKILALLLFSSLPALTHTMETQRSYTTPDLVTIALKGYLKKEAIKQVIISPDKTKVVTLAPLKTEGTNRNPGRNYDVVTIWDFSSGKVEKHLISHGAKSIEFNNDTTKVIASGGHEGSKEFPLVSTKSEKLPVISAFTAAGLVNIALKGYLKSKDINQVFASPNGTKVVTLAPFKNEGTNLNPSRSYKVATVWDFSSGKVERHYCDLSGGESIELNDDNTKIIIRMRNDLKEIDL